MLFQTQTYLYNLLLFSSCALQFHTVHNFLPSAFPVCCNLWQFLLFLKLPILSFPFFSSLAFQSRFFQPFSIAFHFSGRHINRCFSRNSTKSILPNILFLEIHTLNLYRFYFAAAGKRVLADSRDTIMDSFVFYIIWHCYFFDLLWVAAHAGNIKDTLFRIDGIDPVTKSFCLK